MNPEMEPKSPNMTKADVFRDVNVMLWSMKLYGRLRFFHQRFWESETQEAEHAFRIEGIPRLESVAEHSWHVADTVLLLGGHFPEMNLDRCMRLAVLHDKMEITTGDKSPIGRNGTGSTTHAFDPLSRQRKELGEDQAITIYLATLRRSAVSEQKSILREILEARTLESRFVKAVDKLQVLVYIILKKRGEIVDSHLIFTIKYASKALQYFPDLVLHFNELRDRLLLQVARRRETSVSSIEAIIQDQQLTLAWEDIPE